MMQVLVFAKQIPNVNRIEFDAETKRIRRENVELSMNSFDRKAVEEALRIRERKGGRVYVATMGPPSAIEILKEALSMGVDHCYLITDRSYAGADTLVTSRILAKFASGIGPDIILMGKYTLDGETSQVPPEVAELLHLNFKSSVSMIDVFEDHAVVEFENEYGLAKYRIGLPAVFSVSEKINRPRGPERKDIAFEDHISTVGENELSTGVKGSDSPTEVTDTVRIESGRRVEFLQLDDDTFQKIRELLNAAPATRMNEVLEPYAGEALSDIWGVALNDSEISIEIASRISALSLKGRMHVRMIGNISPSKLKGMPCHEYYHLDCTENEPFIDTLAMLIDRDKPAAVIFPSTVDGREVSASIAARLNLGLTADCVDLEWENGGLVQHKPAFGGGIVARIVSKTTPQMATVRPGIFMKAVSEKGFDITELKAEGSGRNERLSFEERPAAFRSIISSRVVIGIGRGVKSKENMPEVMELAQMLNAAVGATRPVVDTGLVPRQQQIGLTGYSIAPDVYIALGVSGRDNHVVGIRNAGKVIAVNNREDAPIFKYADYGIVADLFDFTRRFTHYLSSHSVAAS